MDAGTLTLSGTTGSEKRIAAWICAVVRPNFVLITLTMGQYAARSLAATPSPDWANLLARVARQDKAAFTQLYEHFAPRIKAWVLRMGAPAGKAEDIVQDVMLQLWRRAGQFDPAKADAGTWIFSITRNRFIDVVRQEKRPEVALDDPVLVSADPSPEQAATAGEQAERVAAALAQLPAAQRAIIRQSYFSDLTQQEIAAQDGVPLGTVKSRLRLAFGRLRALLGEQA